MVDKKVTMRTNKKSFGSVIIFQNSEEKRRSSSKSFSIDNVAFELTIEQIKELFELVIDKSQKLNFQEIKEGINNL